MLITPSNGYENIVCHTGFHKIFKVIQKQTTCSIVKQDAFSKANISILH